MEHYWFEYFDGAYWVTECVCGYFPTSLTAKNQHDLDTIDSQER